MCWSIFSTFPLFISLSLRRLYRRICFKWANNTFFKIYKHDRIISFLIGWPLYASKQNLKSLPLAIYRKKKTPGKWILFRFARNKISTTPLENSKKTEALNRDISEKARSAVYFLFKYLLLQTFLTTVVYPETKHTSMQTMRKDFSD